MTLFVAIASQNNSGGAAATSPDGITWTQNNGLPKFAGGADNTWNDICYSADLGKFCCVSSGGDNNHNNTAVSADGVTWTSPTTDAENNSWRSVCWSPTNGIFCAVSSDGTHRVATSPDGVVWTARTSAQQNPWRSVCWSTPLGLFVAVANGGTNDIMTSPDGTTWTAQTNASGSGPPSGWLNVCWNETTQTFCAVGIGYSMTSPDGTTWTGFTQSYSFGNVARVIEGNGGIFVEGGNNGGNATSTNGHATWTATTTISGETIRGLCWDPTTALYIAATDGGSVYSSPSLSTWTQRGIGTHNNVWSAVAVSTSSPAVTGTFVATEATDTMVATGAIGPSGPWTSTGASDIALFVGLNAGLWASTERQDTWRSGGLERFGIDTTFTPSTGTGFQISTNGPDRLIVLTFAAVAVVGQPIQITAISDTAGLEWHHQDFIQSGPNENSDNAAGQIWWAYSHNTLTNDTITTTVSAGGTSSTVVNVVTVKGLNNFAAPWAENNPFSFGAGIGALFNNTATDIKSFTPLATGALDPASSTFNSYDPALANNTVVSGSNHTVTSTGSGNPNNWAEGFSANAQREGRFYFEDIFNVIAGPKYGIGVLFAGNSRTTFIGSGAGGAILRGDGTIHTDAGSVGSLATPANADVIAVATALGTSGGSRYSLVWFRNVTQNGYWNNDPSANPAFLLGGFPMPTTYGAVGGELPSHRVPGSSLTPIAVTDGTSASAQHISNFGQSAFTGTVPGGYVGWPGAIDAAPSRTDYLTMTLDMRFATSGIGIGDVSAPGGFTQIALNSSTGSQRTIVSAINYAIHKQTVLISDNEFLEGPPTKHWTMMFDTLVAGDQSPATWDSIGATDTFNGVGYPGSFGVVGDLHSTEAKDIFVAVGYLASSGPWASTGATDIFSAYGFQPLTGVWASTGAADHFAATGIGRGEDGTWISTEAIDIFTAIGNTPISGQFDTFEAPDRFLALGAGVTRVRRRRSVFVT